MRTARKTKEVVEEGEPHSCIKHSRHVDSRQKFREQRLQTNGVRMGGRAGSSLFLIKCRFLSFFAREMIMFAAASVYDVLFALKFFTLCIRGIYFI